MVDQDKMEDRSRFGKFIYTTYMFPFYDFRLTCLMQLPFNTAGKNASLSEDAIRLLYEQMYNLEHLPLENRREFHISAAHTNFIYLFIYLTAWYFMTYWGIFHLHDGHRQELELNSQPLMGGHWVSGKSWYAEHLDFENARAF